jgi:hypothetical protein
LPKKLSSSHEHNEHLPARSDEVLRRRAGERARLRHE